jgi:hypothetical protein
MSMRSVRTALAAVLVLTGFGAASGAETLADLQALIEAAVHDQATGSTDAIIARVQDAGIIGTAQLQLWLHTQMADAATADDVERVARYQAFLSCISADDCAGVTAMRAPEAAADGTVAASEVSGQADAAPVVETETATTEVATSEPAPDESLAPPIPRDGVAGLWTTSFGDMALTETGGTVEGLYGDDHGRIEGTLADGHVIGLWAETDSDEECAEEKLGTRHWGRIDFFVTNARFTGTWSYCDGDMVPGWVGQIKD